LFNKWLFQEAGFKFPIFLTQFHMLANFLFAMLLMVCFNASSFNWAGYQKHPVKMAALSALFVFKIASNNTSLLTISLSINQMLKSTLPFLMCVLAVFFEGKSFSTKIWLSCLLVIIGTGLTVYKNPEWDLSGFLWAFGSLVGAAIYILLSRLILDEEGFEATNVLVVVSFAGTLILPTWFFLLTEKDEPLKYIREEPMMSTIYITASSTMTVAMNLVHFKLIKVTSTVTTAVVGNLKTLLVFVLSMTHLEKGVNVINVCGVAVGMLGLLLYTDSKLNDSKSKAASAPSAESEQEKLVEEAGPKEGEYGATEETTDGDSQKNP